MTSRTGLVVKNNSAYVQLYKSKTLLNITSKILNNRIHNIKWLQH